MSEREKHMERLVHSVRAFLRVRYRFRSSFTVGELRKVGINRTVLSAHVDLNYDKRTKTVSKQIQTTCISPKSAVPLFNTIRFYCCKTRVFHAVVSVWAYFSSTCAFKATAKTYTAGLIKQQHVIHRTQISKLFL